MKLLKSIIVSASLLIVVVNIPHALAADLYRNGPPKDTDLDGLTDQGEINLFHTDPNKADTDGDGFLDGTEILTGTDPLNKLDPINPATQAQTTTPAPQKPAQWTWYLARASGITSYLLLFLLMISGTGLTSGYIFKLIGPITAWRVHRVIGITLVAFIALHVITLGMDKFMNFTLTELFLPFTSHFKPLYMGLGTIGLYLLILIILTSIVLIITRYKAWRLIHYLTFPTFIVLFIHGVYTGTDSNTLTMEIVYWVTGILAILGFIFRLIKIPSKKIKSIIS